MNMYKSQEATSTEHTCNVKDNVEEGEDVEQEGGKREREALKVSAPVVNDNRRRKGVSVSLRAHHVRAWLSGV